MLIFNVIIIEKRGNYQLYKNEESCFELYKIHNYINSVFC